MYLGGITTTDHKNFLDDILQYDPENNKWIYCGKTKKQRGTHGMDVVPISEIKDYCVP